MRVVVVASASGSGKTTLARAIADRLGVQFVELDALVHGPGWTEVADEELRTRVEPILVSEGWVLDAAYERKLGTLVFDAADLVVWLDLPVRVWLPRLLRRTARRIGGREAVFNDNRESWRTAFWGRESLVVWALRSHVRRRRTWPTELAPYGVVRLRTPAEVDAFLERVGDRA